MLHHRNYNYDNLSFLIYSNGRLHIPPLNKGGRGYISQIDALGRFFVPIFLNIKLLCEFYISFYSVLIKKRTLLLYTF